MRRSPSIVPDTDDRDIYLVLDDFGERLGRAWRETGEERTDRRTVILDLIDGQYSDPVLVVMFNAVEGWARDGSEELADDIVQRCANDGLDVPRSLASFVERYGSGRRQSSLSTT